jgi:hypothetical protein
MNKNMIIGMTILNSEVYRALNCEASAESKPITLSQVKEF